MRIYLAKRAQIQNALKKAIGDKKTIVVFRFEVKSNCSEMSSSCLITYPFSLTRACLFWIIFKDKPENAVFVSDRLQERVLYLSSHRLTKSNQTIFLLLEWCLLYSSPYLSMTRWIISFNPHCTPLFYIRHPHA